VEGAEGEAIWQRSWKRMEDDGKRWKEAKESKMA
jgi:hypothetical protein